MCHSVLAEDDGCVICTRCSKAYNNINGYYDLYIGSDHSTPTNYSPETEHLLYSRDKIISMNHIPGVLPSTFQRHRDNWNMKLDKLKETVNRAGTSERTRVEFMVDDYSSDEFKMQEKFTKRKAEIISDFIVGIQPIERTVLHVGCGGYANRAIPIMYTEMGYQNLGVDVVRSYVSEFLEYGEAYLANATALPFADGAFEVVNFTDILEHLFDPLKGLQEANRVLRKNGHIIIDTPNRGFYKTGNPISMVRCFVEKMVPEIRKPRVITGEWNGEVYFHTEFTKDEIERLLSQSNFKIRCIAAQPLNLFKSKIKSKIKQALIGAKNCDPWFVLAQK